MFFSYLTILSLLICCTTAYCGVVVFNPAKKTFINKNCVKTDSCSLKKATVLLNDYKVIFSPGKVNLGTKMIATYETDSISNLEKYAFVNFIRGCHFGSYVENKKVKKYFNRVRILMGERVPLHHPKWTIDTIDHDPVYNSADEYYTLRHHLYRWNSVPGSYEKKTQNFYGIKTPNFPYLYVTDFPGTAFYENTSNEAINISLKFRMCIFKTSDIPLIAAADDTNFAKPIHCFDWQSSFIFNHRTKKYETKDEIDPFCL